MIVHDPARGVLLLRRHRFVTDTWGWEIPAGRVDPGETLEEAAVREAIEETGWRPLDLEQLGFSHPTNGLMDQRFEYFVASGAEHVGDFERTETESIAWFAPEDVRTLIEEGEIPDGLSVTALVHGVRARPPLETRLARSTGGSHRHVSATWMSQNSANPLSDRRITGGRTDMSGWLPP